MRKNERSLQRRSSTRKKVKVKRLKLKTRRCILRILEEARDEKGLRDVNSWWSAARDGTSTRKG